MSGPKPVVVGAKYNRLTVIEEVDRYFQLNGRPRRMVKVSCDCGVILVVMLENLYAGYSRSCGCLNLEQCYKHGLTGTAFKDVHSNMKARCDNPNHPQYPAYGGRGIKYEPRWKELTAFAEDMYDSYQEGLSLDRIDVNGGYNKVNCRWTNMSVQGHNKRKADGCLFKAKGVRLNNGNPDTIVASIQINGKGCYLASFPTEAEAAKAYDDASELLYGDRPNHTESNDDVILAKVKAKLKDKGFIDEV